MILREPTAKSVSIHIDDLADYQELAQQLSDELSIKITVPQLIRKMYIHYKSYREVKNDR